MESKTKFRRKLKKSRKETAEIIAQYEAYGVPTSVYGDLRYGLKDWQKECRKAKASKAANARWKKNPNKSA